MRAFAQYIMRGRMQAMLVAVAATLLSLLLPPFNYLSGAVVALVTLRRGWMDGLTIVIGAGVVVALFAAVTSINPLNAGLFAAGVWLPVWLLALVLRGMVSLPATLIIAAVIGIAGVGLTYLVLEAPADTWRATLERVIGEIQLPQEGSAPEMMNTVIAQIAPHMTGMLVAAMVLGWLLSVLLARWWQSLLYNPGGFRREFHDLRLSRNFALMCFAIMAVSLLTSGKAQELAANMMVVLVAVYLLHGLALLHGVVAIKGLHTAWLAGFYILGLFILPQLALLLATAAFGDSWLDIRARLSRNKPSGGGSET